LKLVGEREKRDKVTKYDFTSEQQAPASSFTFGIGFLLDRAQVRNTYERCSLQSTTYKGVIDRVGVKENAEREGVIGVQKT
jgi:hypothetical protein